MDADVLRERISRRLAETGKSRVPVSVSIGKGRDYLSDFLNGKKESIGAEVLIRLAQELECPVQFLVDPDYRPDVAGDEKLIRIRGSVGASTEGRVLFATGDASIDFALMPPGATPGSAALRVSGGSMAGVADEGSLIFYDETHTPPTPDMLGHVVVVETVEGDVLVKRLLRGERKGVYDLESTGAPLMPGRKLRWAAHILAVVPPHRARQITRSLAA